MFKRPKARQRNPPQGGSKDFVKDRRAVIDGDRYPYMIGFACQKTIYEVTIVGEQEPRYSFESKTEMKKGMEGMGLDWQSDVNITERIEADPVANCLHSVKVALQSAIEGSKAETYQVYVGGKTNFRNDVATLASYKGGRNLPKPVHYEAIREYLINQWGAIVVGGIETDDQLAIEYTKDPINTVIVSDDKDLNTVPAWRYIPSKDILFKNTEQDATTWFYCQMIMGDTVDNIKGIAGKGKMAAYKILQDCETEEDMYLAVFEAYASSLYPNGVDTVEEDARVDAVLLENAYLLWMVRELDDEGKPKMWRPPE